MTFQNILLALEIVFLSYFFASFPRMKVGNIAGVILSLIIIFATSFYSDIYQFIFNFTKNFWGKIFFIAIAIIVITGIIYVLALTVLIFIAQRKKPNINSTLIILGCRIKATGPTRMLKRRLDTAIEYLNTHPESICIVSGGQGKDEEVAEADAMESYLINNGVGKKRIIKENKSSSTWENFKSSREILDSLGLPRKAIVVTDGFHQFRAGLIAKKLGIETSALASKTEPRFLFIYWIREIMALTKFFIKRKYVMIQ